MTSVARRSVERASLPV